MVKGRGAVAPLPFVLHVLYDSDGLEDAAELMEILISAALPELDAIEVAAHLAKLGVLTALALALGHLIVGVPKSVDNLGLAKHGAPLSGREGRPLRPSLTPLWGMQWHIARTIFFSTVPSQSL